MSKGDEKSNNEKLFSEFPAVTTEEWEKKILADLKGADYNKKLIWKTLEGINVKPYYREEDLEKLSYLNSAPGEYPYARGNKTKDNNWEIRQDIEEDNPEEANKLALESIKNGADSVGLHARKVSTHKQLAALLKDIDISKTNVHFLSSKSYPVLFDLIEEEMTKRKMSKSSAKFSFNFDPLSYLLLHGDFYSNKENNFYEASFILGQQDHKLPGFKAITINGHYFHNAGASAVQEIAFSLAIANEYISQLINEGLSADIISKSMQFSFATGSNYFMEIAKLRAVRMLWAKIIEQYKPKEKDSMKMYVHCYTSSFNKSIYDPYNNVLRATTEAMSAALGGADSITVLPYDIFFRQPDVLSYRLAQNTQIIIKSESYLNKIVDPSAGSYYIENLTDSIAEAAWTLFKEVEAMGGAIEAIKQNFIQNKIEETSEKRNEQIANRKQTVLGINQYPDANEFISDNIDPYYGKKAYTEEPKKIIKTLNIHRASASFEQIRLETENYIKKGNERPKVFLLTIGNLGMRRARATFAANFFGCAGYEIIDNNGFCSVEEGIDAVFKAVPRIVVICSSDEEYETFVPDIIKNIKAVNPEMLFVVAGNPKNSIEKLKEAGVDDFISVTSNIQISLLNYQYKLGII